MTPSKTLASAAVILSLAACAAKVTSPEEYSGYLGNYAGLQEVKAASGTPVMRWVDPAADLAAYQAIYLKPTVLYPEPKATEKVSAQTLQQLARRCDKAAAAELGKVKRLVNKPGPGVLVIAPAITAATAKTEGLKPYEVVPVALVLAGVTTAAGTRDEDSHLYMEFMVTDGATGAVVAKSVRKMEGAALENRRSQIQGNTFDEAIQQAASDARVLFGQR